MKVTIPPPLICGELEINPVSQAIRRSLKGEKDPKHHHISITPKSAIAILPPKKVSRKYLAHPLMVMRLTSGSLLSSL